MFDRPDRGGDVVRAGAFGAIGPVPLLWQHRGAPVGVIEQAGEDARGLRVIGRIDDTRLARLVRTGAVSGLSFGYRVRLAALAARAAGFGGTIPADYAIRGADPSVAIDAAGLMRTSAARPGDLLLFAAGPAQFHLAVQVPGGIVHADAMLRRVVERPGAPPWPLVAVWRFTGD